jgi:hypothetical protein
MFSSAFPRLVPAGAVGVAITGEALNVLDKACDRAFQSAER